MWTSELMTSWKSILRQMSQMRLTSEPSVVQVLFYKKGRKGLVTNRVCNSQEIVAHVNHQEELWRWKRLKSLSEDLCVHSTSDERGGKEPKSYSVTCVRNTLNNDVHREMTRGNHCSSKKIAESLRFAKVYLEFPFHFWVNALWTDETKRWNF